MRKLFLIGLSAILLVNGYYTYTLYKFAKASSKYFEIIDLELDCQQQINGDQAQQLWFVVNKKLNKSTYSWTSYNKHLPACKAYAQYMCWIGNSLEEIESCRKKFND